MKTLADITKRRDAIAAERLTRVQQHTAFLKTNDRELRDLQVAEGLLASGIDLERIGRASNIVHAHGRLQGSPGRGSSAEDSRQGVVADAKSDIATGGSRLAKGYVGVKNYEGFGDQRCDCSYGMGPRHGSIVFSVGLTREAREQIEGGTALSAEQIEDALYLLTNLAAVEQANRVAA